ncbi:hypothetical protein SCH01S_32_00080 [Sphingomonas changbaiensis NBRC 104936]|uniref:Uncharacterized protein n=1 Tax=Sphingomonas changbaiensis NBRC 104936 TaxID=1219043 RepID=A0A0E9MPX7_9SPHN|nr:hypothetical protein [Sphingomonas changbaiensis]GAO39471.1 hypothetical protein SCH01S_32_00080 [Sphingomonas changbaiensis NBRC 104936]
MITRRMRPIGWVAGVASAALGFYLVSLQVAAERNALEGVERKIAVTHRDIRRLETEFSARASLRQLEDYNNEVLALAAPKVGQYVPSGVQLASYSPAEGGDIGRPAATTALASAEAAPAPANRPTFKPAVVRDVGADGVPVIPAVKSPPLIQTVAMIAPVEAPVATPAVKSRSKPAARVPVVQKVALLDDSSMTDIARAAAKEAKGKAR